MPSLKSTLDNLLHTSDPARGCSSKFASSCDLFTILKALAASDTPPETPDGDPSPQTQAQSQTPSSQDVSGARFAALSLSEIPPTPAPSVTEDPFTSTTTSSQTIAETNNTGPSNEQKIAAIVEEFGNLASLYAGEEPERMLAEAKGSLFKGVMMIGNLNLTTHRLLFHAILPPESVLLDAENHSDILMAGPVTMDRHGITPSRRLWMEVHPEMITTYPRGDESGRVRPLQTILLTHVQRMSPFDPDQPCHFVITHESTTGSHELGFDVDNEPSALQWRRAFEAALFRHARRRWRENIALTARKVDEDHDGWSTMRCCVPLDRSTISGISQYHNFATLVGLEVELDHKNVRWRPEVAAAGDFSGRTEDQKPHKRSLFSHLTSRPGTPTRSDSHDSGDETPRRQHTQYIDTTLPPLLAASAGQASSWTDDKPCYEFNVAVLNDQASFAEALSSAVEAARDRQLLPGASRHDMTLEVAGYDCLATDEDLESHLRNSSSSDETRLHSFTRDMRKAEKAAMAAQIFGLKEDEGVYLKRCYVVQGVIPSRGHIILSRSSVCFWRRATVGDDIKYRFIISDVKGAEEAPSLRAGFHGLALKIHGHHDLKFEFWSKSSRDDVLSRIKAISSSTDNDILNLERTASPSTLASTPPITTTSHAADILVPDANALFTSRAFPDEAFGYMPFVANKPFQAVSRLTPRHFVCLTIGSRGDVQPYIALGLRLKQDQHRVTIVTHPEFKGWIESYGIEHREAGGDPTALMKLSAEHKMFSPGFFKESLGSFRQWLDDLLLDSWRACQGADVLIESPSTMSGVHIAEALKIPYFRAFTMPWTRTNAYPQAFMVPAFEMGPSFNYSTYVLFDNIIWRATAGQINRWRKRYLDLPSTDMSTLSITKVPFLYNFSPAVVPKPLDWHDEISITGYWNLEDSDADWTPPPKLEQFMDKAKADGRPLVYIGFGSIVVPKPSAMTKNIIAAVEKADVRAIIAKGWSSRGAEEEEVEFPDSCYSLEKVPHGWLFPKVSAALHHGGAGTVGASLRAGIPTLIKPWFGDQFFWAIRVTKLGAGLKVPSLRTEDIAHALIKATTDKTMIEKASRVGMRIRSENGVDNALQAIHYNIVRAGSDRTKLQ